MGQSIMPDKLTWCRVISMQLVLVLWLEMLVARCLRVAELSGSVKVLWLAAFYADRMYFVPGSENMLQTSITSIRE